MTWLAQYLVFHLTSDSKGNTSSSLTIIKSLFPITRFSQTYIKFMTFFYLYPGKTFPKPLPSGTFLLLLDVLFLYFNLDCILSLLACTTAAVWQEKFSAF